MKRTLAMLLTLMMVLSMLPAMALATDTTQNPLPAPTNLRWEGKNMYWDLVFIPETNTSSYYECRVYWSPTPVTDIPVDDHVCSVSGITSPYYFGGASTATTHGVGYYYFRIRAFDYSLGSRRQSEWSELSPAFYLDTPPVVLTATNLGWNGLTPTWTDNAPSPDAVNDYVITYWFSTEPDPVAPLQCSWEWKYPEDLPFTFPQEEMFGALGEGYYFFNLCIYSRDYSVALSGEPSELSPPIYYDGTKVTTPPSTAPTTPIDVYWNDNGSPRWEVITDGSVTYDIELGIISDPDEGVESCDCWIPLLAGFDGASEAFAAGALWAEFDARTYATIQEWGCEYCAFRVRAVDTATEQTSDWVCSNIYAPFESGVGDPQMLPPSDLEWGYAWEDGEKIPMGGSMFFKNNAGGHHTLTLYRVNDDGTSSYIVDGWVELDADDPYGSFNFSRYMEPGYTYYVDAYADTNDPYIAPSVTVSSSTWFYEVADVDLTTTNLRWSASDLTMLWDINQPQLVDRYYLRFYRSDTPVTEIPFADYFEADYCEGDWDAPQLSSYLLTDNGPGYYYFRVRALTGDVSLANSGEWSALSPAFHYQEPETPITVTDPHWEGLDLAWTDNTQSRDQISEYQIQYYFSEQANATFDPEEDFILEHWNVPHGGKPMVLPDELIEEYGDGYYYFRIKLYSADVLNLGNSEWSAISSALHFQTPDLTLSASNPGWNGWTLTWTDNVQSPELASCYDVQYYYAETADVIIDEEEWSEWYSYDPEELPISLPAYMLREYGEGYYYYRIQIISADPLTAATGEWSALSPAYHYEGATLKAPSASDLQWNVERWESGYSHPAPGAISFAGALAEGAEYTDYKVDFYRKGDTADTLINTMYTGIWSGEDFCTLYPLEEFPEDFITGTYYYVVTPMGDNAFTTDGDPVTSPAWSYVQPELTLSVSNPVWGDDMSMLWTSDDTYIRSYDVEFRFCGASTDVEDFIDYDWNRYNIDDRALPGPYTLQAGNGNYFFRVRAISNDINTAVTSPWSEWSAPFAYTAPSVTLTASNLDWDEANKAVTWDLNADTSLVDYYQVRFYYSETNVRPAASIRTTRYYPGNEPFTISSYVLEDNGAGFYWFQVRIYTNDPTKASSNTGYSEISPAFYYAGPDGKLGTPSDLQWNIEYQWEWDENDNRLEVPATRYGNVAFKRADPDQSRYEIWFYRVGQDEPVSRHSWGFGSNSTQVYFDASSFIYEDLPSGEYYFKARARGDGINYSHGDWATSDTWTYVRPDPQLKAPTNLSWSTEIWEDEICALWSPVDDAGYYEVEFFYSATEKGAKDQLGGTFDIHAGEEQPNDSLWDNLTAENGDGWYFFQVRAISQDITKTRNSEWSVMSPGFNMTNLTTSVNNALDAIDTSAPVTEIQDAVSQIDNLDEALAADTTNSNTVEKIAQLEQAMGETTIDANDAPSGFDAAGVTVTGAVLNAGTDATLEIGSVDANTAPEELNPTQYNNTITFTMDIPQAEDKDTSTAGLQLAVPVKITLPIPGNINPAFLVVLHYQQSTGTWEELMWPHIYQERGKWFATFVVDSMSPFALAERQITAIAYDDGIEVSAYLPTAGEETRYLCALYSADGQMLGMTMLDPHSSEYQWIGVDGVTDDMVLQVLSVDTGDGWVPLSEPQQVTIQF